MMSQATEYGLHMQSWPNPTSEFTSIALEGGNSIKIDNDKTTLKFKLLNRDEFLFGVIFRIVTDQNKNIDLMYSVDESDVPFPNLIIGDVVYPISKELKKGSWLDVSLTLDPKKKSVILEYDDEELIVHTAAIDDTQEIRIFFGVCPLTNYDLDNIASVNIKDIRISQKDKNIREWDMRFHQGDTCYDNIYSSPATTQNGQWLIDNHIVWNLLQKKDFDATPSIAFDPNKAIFYMTHDGNSISTFDCKERKESYIKVNGGCFATTYHNNLYFIPEQNKLLSYNLDQNIYSFFDFGSSSWTGNKMPENPHKEHYWNNTVTYNPEDSTLISFGGYGHYQFNHELLISYPHTRTKPQRRTHLKEIDPRYTPASALVDSILYVFGGRGCPSGKQEMTQRHYYDLYSINIHTMEVSKVWEITGRPVDGDFVPGSNMIYDKTNDCFYVFSSQRGCTLMRISRTEPMVETMSVPVFIPLDAQYLYLNLYCSENTGKFYALYQQTQVDNKSQVYIYELEFPPIALKESFMKPYTGENGSDGRGRTALLITFLTTAIAFSLSYVLARQKKQNQTKDKVEEAKIITDEIEELQNYDFSRKSICFFGGFKVCDKEGEDITDIFTPTLKALLILLILRTGQDAKGISGNKLIQTLWYDKTEESAKNNRNVYMSKLRNALDKVGDVKVLNQKGFWSISFENGALCDYLETIRLFKEQQKDGKSLEQLIELLLRGVMLPNVENDWVDLYKNDFSNNTIDFLTGLLKKQDLSETFMLKIADTLFQHDFINEDALKVKCNILYKQGKKGLAKTVFDTFCKDYQSSLGTSFPVSMLDLINEA